MTEELSQLARLARPFPKRFVHTNPSGGGSYVTHSVVNEKLLAVLGGFDFELVEVLRGDVPALQPNPNASSKRGKEGAPGLSFCVCGAVCRLRVVVDGRTVTVEEIGDCESPQNWPHDGARLKDAMSDALKRCAMRLGVGLHLWSQSEFTLFDQLWKQSGSPAEDNTDEMLEQLRARAVGLDLAGWLRDQGFEWPWSKSVANAIAAKCAIREEELSAPFVEPRNEDGTAAPTLLDEKPKGKKLDTGRHAEETASL